MNLVWDGHEIIEASGGAECLALVASETPDAVLLDVMMPNIDGIEALKRIRESEETVDLPVVLISARVREARSLDPVARKTVREARLRELTEHVVTYRCRRCGSPRC